MLIGDEERTRQWRIIAKRTIDQSRTMLSDA
jgi:hypothetical protein